MGQAITHMVMLDLFPPLQSEILRDVGGFTYNRSSPATQVSQKKVTMMGART